jgi:hypothetical protein
MTIPARYRERQDGNMILRVLEVKKEICRLAQTAELVLMKRFVAPIYLDMVRTQCRLLEIFLS